MSRHSLQYSQRSVPLKELVGKKHHAWINLVDSQCFGKRVGGPGVPRGVSLGSLSKVSLPHWGNPGSALMLSVPRESCPVARTWRRKRRKIISFSVTAVNSDEKKWILWDGLQRESLLFTSHLTETSQGSVETCSCLTREAFMIPQALKNEE